MIFGSIINAVGGIATSYLENKVEATKAKGVLKDSWKDEWILGLWSIPLILSFTGEAGVSIVMRGFEALERAPTFYTASLGIMVGASFGVKSAAKFFKHK